MKLNIYKTTPKGRKVDKTYEANTCDIMFGTVEDLIEMLDGITTNLSDEDLMKTLVKNLKNIKPMILNVFQGMTEEELRRTDTKEIIAVVYEIIQYGLNSLTDIVDTQKN